MELKLIMSHFSLSLTHSLFLNQQMFDDRWHKIMLGVTDNRAKLWVDCQPVKSVDGYIEYPLKTRGYYDINDGHLSIAQHVNQRHSSYQVTIFVKLIIDDTFLITFLSFFSHKTSPPVSVNFLSVWNIIFFIEGEIFFLFFFTFFLLSN